MMKKNTRNKIGIAIITLSVFTAACKKNNDAMDAQSDSKTAQILCSHQWKEVWREMTFLNSDTSYIYKDSGVQKYYVHTFYKDGTYSSWYNYTSANLIDSAIWQINKNVLHMQYLTGPKVTWDRSIVSINDDSLVVSDYGIDSVVMHTLYMAR